MSRFGLSDVVVLLGLLAATAFWVWTLTVVARRVSDPNRIFWTVVIAVFPALGAAAYWLSRAANRPATSS